MEGSYKRRVVTAPQKVFPWLKKTAHIKDMKDGRWNCFITIDGVDYQEYGTTEEDAVNKMANRILCSEYLTAVIPDEAIKP